MSQRRRLAAGGRIDRERVIEFTFNGKSYRGHPGDTLASALLANGVRLVGRSLKYHRPRGIVAAGSEEPNAVVQLGRGAKVLPNQIATRVELYDGLEASSVSGWPSLRFDLRSATGFFSRFMPPGFYYKTFMWPKGMWRRYEHQIRRATGLGRAPEEPDPDRYEKVNAHCDVLVVGAGPAGLSAALAAARSGARVVLADEGPEPGGSLLGSRSEIAGKPALEWVSASVRELASFPEVRILTRSTAFGYYSHNFVGILEQVTDHLPEGSPGTPRQRLWRVRAKQVVLATGAIERPLVFPNNDRPGIMLASAVSTYIHRYGVAPGTRAVVFANNDGAYQTVLDLADAGVPVAAVVDVRPESTSPLPTYVRQRGIAVIAGNGVVNVRGARGVSGVDVSRLSLGGEGVERGKRTIPCDLLAVSGGWSPAVHLHAQAGGKPVYDSDRACFVPGEPVQAERSAGSCNGAFALNECLAQGMAAGRAAARDAGFDAGDDAADAAPLTSDHAEEPTRAMWVVPSPSPIGYGAKRFIDFQNDVSASDIAVAVREGYESIEHVKRYTTLGMGTDQGKLGNTNGIGFLAQTLGVDIEAVGNPTYRPMYTAVAFGALAGREIGDHFDPIRKTAIHSWHVENGAAFENVGQWKRPWYYPRPDESMHDAVNRECVATRNGVGVVDASTLGKIDIQGPDAGTLLDRVYTNSYSRLAPGRCRYGLMLGEDGMVMDDGVTARLGEHHYLMTTTTGGAARVMGWLERWLQTEWPDLKVYLASVTDQWATISISGPGCRDLMGKLSDDIDFSGEAFPFMSNRTGTVAGVPARVFRIAFAGELSYEINVSANYGRAVWEAVMEAGREYDITPYGTEAMHVLRAEKGFIIVGQDSDGSMTPVDLGLGAMVSQRKDFLGKRSLSRSDMLRDDRKQLVGLLTETPTEVLPEGGQIVDDPSAAIPVPMLGHVTSSYYSACLGRSIALGVVKGGHSRMGDLVHVPLAGGSSISATITNTVFYDPEGARQRM